MNMKDIRLCPHTIETIDNTLAKVYHHGGFKCWLSEEIYNFPHATVYMYALQYPNGGIQRGMDLLDVNETIFGGSDFEEPPF